MTSIPNGLYSYGDDTMNIHGFTPIEMMSSNLRNHESMIVQSMFNTSDHTNHHGLFSSSRAFNCYQDSHVSSSSFDFSNSHMSYHMRKNMVSTFGMPSITQISNNPHLSQISITQTITNSYSAIVPTNNLITSQNEYQRAMNPNIFNSPLYPPNFVDKHVEKESEILNPTPLNTIFPHQTSVFPRNLDMFSFSPKHHPHQYVSYRQPVKKHCGPTKHFEETFDDFDSKENGEYDGRTHSLPYKKYGPYTCPKCNRVFDTSQKFAAHISSMHYKNETIEEKFKRYNARNKKRSRRTNQLIHEESRNIQPEERVAKENGGNNNIASDIETLQHQQIVKEEPIYDLF
ncbi:Zinc finger C2H2-type [Arabidopsis thaliana x Arabidopsis arenosa]|uniref:Zinc finger C2H2-type n=1 Tax=Arabidopsis thaliana x Arabidopsis arenosa TaxID=1240361 RepID=A0A8T1YZU5_9BRAS|nr:Zinc finger C2H2-type [Arabidopsis thaliana x Arabidopsis arenosa]